MAWRYFRNLRLAAIKAQHSSSPALYLFWLSVSPDEKNAIGLNRSPSPCNNTAPTASPMHRFVGKNLYPSQGRLTRPDNLPDTALIYEKLSRLHCSIFSHCPFLSIRIVVLLSLPSEECINDNS